MFIRLHGGNGMGKSYPVYQLLRNFSRTEFRWPAQLCPNDNKTKEKVVGYVLPGNLFVCGKYDDSQTGGGDALGNFTMHYPWLGDYVTQTFPHVIYESMMASLSNPRYFNDLEDRMAAEKHLCQGMVHLMPDTPWPVVRDRIVARRANNPRFDGQPNKMDKMLANYSSAVRYFKRYQEQGRDAREIDHTKPYEELLEVLSQGGWNPWT